MRRVGIQKLRPGRMLAILALSMVLAAACASSDRRAKSLESTLDNYKALIRWGDLGAAMRYLHPEHLPTSREAELIMKRFEQIEINGYLVKGQSPAADENTFLQTAEISFANRHNMVVNTINDHQVWRWEQDSGRWLLISGLPDITRR